MTTNELHTQMGTRIREKRENLKLSRDRLAESIDVSPQFLAQIELGKRGMSPLTLYKMCGALGTSADYVLMGRDEKTDISPVFDMISNLDPEYMPYLEEIIKTFVLAVNK